MIKPLLNSQCEAVEKELFTIVYLMKRDKRKALLWDSLNNAEPFLSIEWPLSVQLHWITAGKPILKIALSVKALFFLLQGGRMPLFGGCKSWLASQAKRLKRFIISLNNLTEGERMGWRGQELCQLQWILGNRFIGVTCFLNPQGIEEIKKMYGPRANTTRNMAIPAFDID